MARRASALAVALALAATFPGSDAAAKPPSEGKLIALAKGYDVARIDSTLRHEPFEAWLRRAVGPSAVIHWEANDCGEGGGGGAERSVPLCVEADCRPASGGRVAISLMVGDTEHGVVGEPGVFFASVDSLGPEAEATSLHELLAVLRDARSLAARLALLPDRPLDDTTAAIRYVQTMPARRLDPRLPDVPVAEWIGRITGDPAGVTWRLAGWKRVVTGWELEHVGDFWAAVEVGFRDPRMEFGLGVRIGTFQKGVWGDPQVSLFTRDKRPGHGGIARPALADLESLLKAARSVP